MSAHNNLPGTSCFWDQVYSDESGECSSWGVVSFEFERKCREFSNGARVLDLGCGDGRHSLYLAELGIKVTAVDFSRAALARLDHFSGKYRKNVTLVLSDVEEYSPNEQFDFVICSGLLNCLEDDMREHLIANIKRWTAPMGLNYVVGFIATSDEDMLGDGFVRSNLSADSLIGWYKDWKDIEQTERTLIHGHHGHSRHQHVTQTLFARKPKAARVLAL